MRIGVIGSGKIGGTVGGLWVRAGHEVRFGSRTPERLDALVASLGTHASRGTIAEAAAFGEVLLVAVPLAALPEVGRELGAAIAGKVVIETGNPYPARDGAIAEQLIAGGKGTGPFARDHLLGARVVRGFNSVWDQTLVKEAHRAEPRVGIPLAADDPDALAMAAGLVRDAGFDPVVVGGLETARRFDAGTPVYNTGMSGPDLRRALGVA